MAKLVLSFNGEPLQEYDLDQETMTIGRKAENDIQIDNLAVSAKHAKILTILDDSFIEDLESTNGTFINGEKIRKHALRNGEVIAIGKHELAYINNLSGAGSGNFERTMVIRPDAAGMPEQDQTGTNLEKSIGKIASDIASADAASSEDPGAACLKFLNGANKGKELDLTKALTTLGKPGVQVAAITRRPTGYFLIVVDAASSPTNPLVNGSEVGRQAHALNSGDEIEVAGVSMRLFIG
jgi:pSer/pThr/pTyr-binding forkhead associated (FHA) protein